VFGYSKLYPTAQTSLLATALTLDSTFEMTPVFTLGLETVLHVQTCARAYRSRDEQARESTGLDESEFSQAFVLVEGIKVLPSMRVSGVERLAPFAPSLVVSTPAD